MKKDKITTHYIRNFLYKLFIYVQLKPYEKNN